MISKNHAITYGDWATIAITKHFCKMLKHEPKVLKDKDPEELHQMRVAMRRLRSAISGFALAINLPKEAQEKNVAQIAHKLGNLRDLDVLQYALENQYKPILISSEVKSFNQVLKILKKQRQQEFKQVKLALNSDSYQALKEGLEKWLEKPKYKPIATVSIELVLPDLLLPELSQLFLHPGWLIGVKIEADKINVPHQLDSEAVENILKYQENILHSLRKKAKRSRYQMELFTQFYDNSYSNYIKQIKQIQTVLGEIQDCFVLAAFLTKIFKSNFKKHMPNLAKQLIATRYQRWQEWNILQQQFLHIKTRQDLRQIINTKQNEL